MKTSWKVVLGFLGVVLPALFTYLAARVDSNEAKIRAEVAYVTMQGNVKELQEASYKQALQIAKLEGMCAADRPSYEKSLPSADARPLLPVRPSPPVQLKAPPDFSQAVQSYKAKK